MEEDMNAPIFFLSWGMLFVGVLMNVFGVYIIKLKINTMGEFQFNSLGAILSYFFALARYPFVFVGAIMVFFAPLPYAIALSRMELSVAYPVSVALSCLIVLPLTVLFLGEVVSISKVIGIVLMLVSLYFLYK